MATLPCPHPPALSESQDWYRQQKESVKSRQASGYDTKKKLRHRIVKRSYINRIRTERQRKLYDRTVALLLTEQDVVAPALLTVDVERRFRQLATEWKNETGNVSSLTALVAHEKYRKIVKLGWDVVPSLLRDLRDNNGFWLPALQEITGITPFDPHDAGNRKRVTKAWIQWGRRKKYI